ncbi:hypothetical protein ACLB2K_038846 [Fragaria x ananassa]
MDINTALCSTNIHFLTKAKASHRHTAYKLPPTSMQHNNNSLKSFPSPAAVSLPEKLSSGLLRHSSRNPLCLHITLSWLPGNRRYFRKEKRGTEQPRWRQWQWLAGKAQKCGKGIFQIKSRS